MPIIKTYLKSGQVIETVGRVEIVKNPFGLESVEWTDIKSGERAVYASVEHIAAITEVIETEASE